MSKSNEIIWKLIHISVQGYYLKPIAISCIAYMKQITKMWAQFYDVYEYQWIVTWIRTIIYTYIYIYIYIIKCRCNSLTCDEHGINKSWYWYWSKLAWLILVVKALFMHNLILYSTTELIFSLYKCLGVCVCLCVWPSFEWVEMWYIWGNLLYYIQIFAELLTIYTSVNMHPNTNFSGKC